MDKSGEVVVLTGASGCLGHHTLKLLVGRDDSVEEIRCLDLEDPQELMMKIIGEEQQKLTLKRSGREKQIKWIKGDVSDEKVVEQTLIGADCVIHCSAKIEVWRKVEDHELPEFEKVNIRGTENLLKAAIKHGVSKFIHVSSFEAYFSFGTLFYSTEEFLKEIEMLLSGHSGWTKRVAEQKVREYNNSKLEQRSKSGHDKLRTVILRFPMFYGEFEKYYLNKALEITKFLGGQIHRLDKIWSRQQPIYVGNAAWSLIVAKRTMDMDPSVAGEDFNVTDSTPVMDPFDFIKPFLEGLGMRVTDQKCSSLPIFLYLYFGKPLNWLNPFCWFKDKKNAPAAWYDCITLPVIYFLTSMSLLSGSKASVRLNYQPSLSFEESKKRTIDWLRENWNFDANNRSVNK